MSVAEAQWRAGVGLRNTVGRVRASMSVPAWDRSQLASVLRAHSAAARAARASDWSAAHASLTHEIATRPHSFVIGASIRDPLVNQINSEFTDAAADARARADRIVAGEYDLLGYRALRFDNPNGPSPDWHFDPIHNRRAPRRFWTTVPFLDPSCGDHKIIWELNRHQHLLTLGRAYWLTGDATYRDTAIAHLLGWIRENPPLVGINWASMLELGFRSLSWIWAIHFFADEIRDDDHPWLVDVLVALDRQLEHIEQNLSYYFSPNTHLLGEALALYVAGQSLPLLASAERYAAVGRRVLSDELARQIGKDGGHLERSTHYHRYTLDFYILAAIVAHITSDPAASLFESSVARLAFAARLLADTRGRLPHIGDDDGGMLLPMCGREPDDVRDSLATACALVDRPDLCIDTAPEETFWLLAHPRLQPLLERALRGPVADAIGSAALPDTGYYISRSPAGDHLVVDAGEHGYENGGHAHADALSMTLSVHGVPLLIDPGTGSYTADPAARDTFRSSMLHNTVVVDRSSQSRPKGPFHWAHAAKAQAHIWRVNPGFDYIEASHDGYTPIQHRRHVLALHGDLIIVADLVAGGAEHDVQVHWHLAPQWSVETEGRRAILRAPGERVELAVSRGRLEQVHGSDAPGVGWHAPVYGRLERTAALRVSESGPLPIWIVTVFGLNPANEVLTVEPVPVSADDGELERGGGVRITRSHSLDLFGIAALRAGARSSAAEEHRTWRLGSYETDAHMLFCRTANDVSRLALVDGALVRTADRHTLFVQLPHEAPDLHVDLGRRGTQPDAAHIGGHVFGAQIQLAGRELPVAVERRALSRPPAPAGNALH